MRNKKMKWAAFWAAHSSTLVRFEKFERTETSQFLNCFNKVVF